MTLDNPAILEQKLEALEHHKRVLENQRRAKLNAAGHHGAEAQPPAPPSLATHPDYARSYRQAPPPTTTTATSGNGGSNIKNIAAGSNGGKFNEKIYENQQQLYENMRSGGEYAAGAPDSDEDHQQQVHNYANYRNVNEASGGRLYGNVKPVDSGVVGNNGGQSMRCVMQPSQAELVNPYPNYYNNDRRSQGDIQGIFFKR